MKNIVVSHSDFNSYGCVFCGCDFAYNYTGISGGGCVVVKCGECEKTFLILADGLEKSLVGFGTGKEGEFEYPLRQPHPRAGMNKHAFKLPDIKPEDEGEFFAPRGIGYDLAGFVKSKEGGERIVKMFEVILRRKVTTWLDYRPSEPLWIQVKVQKEDCDLEKLNKLTQDGIITINKIKQCVLF
jgi:hypothetical protein